MAVSTDLALDAIDAVNNMLLDTVLPGTQPSNIWIPKLAVSVDMNSADLITKNYSNISTPLGQVQFTNLAITGNCFIRTVIARVLVVQTVANAFYFLCLVVCIVFRITSNLLAWPRIEKRNKLQ